MFGTAMPAIFSFLRMVAPVFPIPIPGANTTLLTRFDDVQEVYSNADISEAVLEQI